jgi:hypothetical protein
LGPDILAADETCHALVPDGIAAKAQQRFYRIEEIAALADPPGPRILNFQRGGPCATLVWRATPGRTYAVQGSTNLWNWNMVLAEGLRADGERMAATVAAIDESGATARFFRVVDDTPSPILDLTVIPAEIVIGWKSSPDRSYRVAASRDLNDWSDTMAQDLPGNGSWMNFAIPFPAGSSENAGFFRVEEE